MFKLLSKRVIFIPLLMSILLIAISLYSTYGMNYWPFISDSKILESNSNHITAKLNHPENTPPLVGYTTSDIRPTVGNNNPYNSFPITNNYTPSNSVPIVNITDLKPKKISGLKNLAKDGVPILTFHAIDDKVGEDKACFIKPSVFDSEMKYLLDNGFTTLTFEELKDYKKFKKPILITFDDGYRDVYSNAYPILKKYKLKATMFLISSYINQPEYLTTEEIKEMSCIFSFQSHTVHHVNLTKLSSEEIEKECSESKKVIEDITGKKVIALSYPCSQSNDQVIQVAKKHYTYCVTTKYGFYKTNDNSYNINRISGYYLYNLRDFKGWI